MSPVSLRKLAAEGARHVVLSLQGAEPAVDDWHEGPGHFEATLAALSAARSLGLAAVVTTTITRSNHHVLDRLPRLLKARAVGLWALRWPRVDRGDELVGKVARLGIGLPPALAAAQAARRLRLPVVVQGAPLCALGPFAADAVRSAARSHPTPCESCSWRVRCPGVDAAYARRFGDRELHPREGSPPPTPTHDLANALG